MTAAKASAINIPFCPPKARPASMSSSVMTVSRRVVLNTLLIMISVKRSHSLDAGHRLWASGVALDGAKPRHHTILALGLTLQCSVQRLVQSCLGFFVLGGRDFALLLFNFELE